jgi:hypothetical protein
MNTSASLWIKWFTLALAMKEPEKEEMTPVVEEEGRSRRLR